MMSVLTSAFPFFTDSSRLSPQIEVGSLQALQAADGVGNLFAACLL